MSTPEEYLCTCRPSFSLASSVRAQTASAGPHRTAAPSIHPSILVCELGQGGFLRPPSVQVGKETISECNLQTPWTRICKW